MRHILNDKNLDFMDDKKYNDLKAMKEVNRFE